MKAHKCNGRAAVTGNLCDGDLPFPGCCLCNLSLGVSFTLSGILSVQRTRSPLGWHSSRPRCAFIREEEELSLLVSLKRIKGETLIAIAWVTFPLPDQSLSAEPGQYYYLGLGHVLMLGDWVMGLATGRNPQFEQEKRRSPKKGFLLFLK